MIDHAFERELVLKAMSSCRFDYNKRLEWFIWGAKLRTCSKCHQGPHQPCLNLSDVRMGRANPRVTKKPHEERIDWVRMIDGLKKRGYIG